MGRVKYVESHPDEFLDRRGEGDEGEEQEEGGIEREESQCQLVKRLIETKDDSCDSSLQNSELPALGNPLQISTVHYTARCT